MAEGQVEGGKALRATRAAEIDAASHRPTAAQKQQQIAELEERAELFGDPVKQSAQAKVLERKWLRFLLVHGEAYKFVALCGEGVLHYSNVACGNFLPYHALSAPCLVR
eukprot:scaffold14107_cov52-Phaeocystis_antarctica.AAC.1